MSDFDEPTNPLLTDALRDYAADRSPELRVAMFEQLADAMLMVPAKRGDGPLQYERLVVTDGESVEIILATTNDGIQTMCAFSNGAELVAWAPNHPYLVLTGRELANLALSNQTGRLVINANGEELMCMVYADELVALATGNLPDGIERPEATLAPTPEPTGGDTPDEQSQIQLGPPPFPLTEDEKGRVISACQQTPGIIGATLIGVIMPGQPAPVRAVVLKVDGEPDQPAQQVLFETVQQHLNATEGDPVQIGFTIGLGPILEVASQVGEPIF